VHERHTLPAYLPVDGWERYSAAGHLVEPMGKRRAGDDRRATATIGLAQKLAVMRLGLVLEAVCRFVSAILPGSAKAGAMRHHPGMQRLGSALGNVIGVSPCGLFPRWRAGSGLLAATEYLDKAHRPAADRARLGTSNYRRFPDRQGRVEVLAAL
jgi:hypothetical protein